MESKRYGIWESSQRHGKNKQVKKKKSKSRAGERGQERHAGAGCSIQSGLRINCTVDGQVSKPLTVPAPLLWSGTKNPNPQNREEQGEGDTWGPHAIKNHWFYLFPCENCDLCSFQQVYC